MIVHDTCLRLAFTCLCAGTLLGITTHGARAQALEWIRTTARPGDYGQGVAVDNTGHVHLAGTNRAGNLPEHLNGFIARYDAMGNFLWRQDIGAYSEGNAAATDDLGHVYLAGRGLYNDTLLAKYDAAGNSLWTRQIANWETDREVFTRGVALDGAGAVYVVGETQGRLGGASKINPGIYGDAFLLKYDTEGTLLWSRQFGAGLFDDAVAVVADGSGNAYVAGRTWLPQPDREYAYLAKYDASGARQWTQLLGPGSRSVGGLAMDALGNLYLSGWTERPHESIFEPEASATGRLFLAKYDPSGDLLWGRQFGSLAANERNSGVAVDGDGSAFVGWTSWNSFQTFLSKYDATGDFVWTQLVASGAFSEASPRIDAAGNVYFAGTSNQRAFLAKISSVPEPSTLMVAALALVGVGWWRGREMHS